MRSLALTLLFGFGAFAQTTTSAPQTPYTVSTLPATCTPGAVYSLQAGTGGARKYSLYTCNGDGISFSISSPTTISIGSVTQTPSGTNPTVTVTGSANNLVLSFTFPAAGLVAVNAYIWGATTRIWGTTSFIWGN